MNPEDQHNLPKEQTHETMIEAPANDYLTLLTNISDTVLITNEHGDFRFICPNIDIIFGFTDKEIAQFGNIGRLWNIDLIHQYPPGTYQEIRNIEIPITDKYES